ncbi:hypothetical protein X975_15610, partial [Stegodyphus mimosarum]
MFLFFLKLQHLSALFKKYELHKMLCNIRFNVSLKCFLIYCT